MNPLKTCILILMILLTGLAFQWSNAIFSDGIGGVKTTVGIIVILAVARITAALRLFGKPPPTAAIVILWLAWVLLSSIAQWPERGVYEWIASDLLPVMFWPLVYLMCFSFGKADPGWFWNMVPFFSILSLLWVALFFFSVGRLRADTGLTVQCILAYFPLLIIPWIMLLRQPLLRFGTTLLVATAVVASLKRGGGITLAVMIAVYLFVELAYASGRHRFWYSILAVTVLAIGVAVAIQIDISLDHSLTSRLASLEADEGSGRLNIYSEAIDLIRDASVFELIAGRGYQSTLAIMGVTAHNDWLEVLIDYGLVGLSLYSLLHFCLVVRMCRLIRRRSPCASAFAVSYAGFFSLSMYSHLIIYPSYFVYLVSFWGFLDGMGDVLPPFRTIRSRPSRPSRCPARA